jgi:four helix bundle protein
MGGVEARESATDLVVALGEPLERIAQADADLAKQLRRAGPSVLLNLGEGARRKGADRLHCWRVAAGSAGEVRDILVVARAWGYLDESLLRRAEGLVDRVLAVLWRLTHPRC